MVVRFDETIRRFKDIAEIIKSNPRSTCLKASSFTCLLKKTLFEMGRADS